MVVTTEKHTSVSEKTYEIPILGMNCAGCALGIENSLNKMSRGKVIVSFPLETAFITTKEESNIPQLTSQIEKLGYRVGEFETERHERIKLYKLIFCALVTAPLLLHDLIHIKFLKNIWYQLFTVTPVLIIGIQEFGPSAFGAIKTLRPNMDSLVLFGALAAYCYSLINLLSNTFGDSSLGSFVFFEASASIVTFLMLGSFIEHKAVAKTSSSLKALLNIQPINAKKINSLEDNEYKTIDAREIQVNDFLMVNEGDKVPADGIVVKGEGSVDESMLTGESSLIDKSSGSNVIGGTILKSGNFKIKATAIGDTSIIAQIVKLVRDSQTKKPPIQKIGDKVSAVFIPCILIFAIATFLYWSQFYVSPLSYQESFMRALSVIVIACPCAMGLATPLALAVGLGRAANNGFLIKDSSAFEELPRIKNIIFDKTGTLTTDSISIENVDYLNNDKNLVDSIINSLENFSSHPLAKVLKESFKSTELIEFQSVKEISGEGINAIGKDGLNYRIGSIKTVKDANFIENYYNHSTKTTENSATVESIKLRTDLFLPNIFVSVEDKVICSITTGEKIRDGAKEIISYLQQRNKKIFLLSGDNQERTKHIGNLVSIPANNIYGSQYPKDKLNFIDNLVNVKHEKTVFVGDGINDSPSLSLASVGIAPSKGTDLAISSAQVVLLKEDLRTLKKVFNLADKTSQTIRQNLFWAFFYNIIAIPFAALGYLTPTLAALTMTISDIVIVVNSLLLKLKKI